MNDRDREMEEREEEEKKFRVVDRRRFTETGDSRPDEDGSEASSPKEEAEPETGDPPGEATSGTSEPWGAAAGAGSDDMQEGGAPPVPITFSTFVMSLSTQALFCLGEVQDPRSGKTHQDLDAARELIDVLAMLEEKTRGNLDEGEGELIGSILYDLRMRFVEKRRASQGPS